MIFKITLFILLLSTSLFAQKMGKITITGIAENSKAGAIIITNDNKVFFLEGISSWNDKILKKYVEADGVLIIEYHDKNLLVNEKGEYSQGLSGEVKKISKPVWKLVNQTSGKDNMLENLKKLLPKNWFMKIENEKLEITCTEQAYVLNENKINSPVNTESLLQKEERIKKNGRLIYGQFVFVMKMKLSHKEIEQIKSENNKIIFSITKLQKNLNGIPKSYKDGIYRPRNIDEEKLVSGYLNEKNHFERKIIKLPDYQSEKFALYLESEKGIETEYVSIFPGKYSEEMYRMKIEVFGKLLEKCK